MAYVYLLEMHKFIDKRLADAREALEKAEVNKADTSRQQGRIDTLIEFQDFLTKNFNPKLPRRVRETYFGKKDYTEIV
jgi:hypothetical protein